MKIDVLLLSIFVFRFVWILERRVVRFDLAFSVILLLVCAKAIHLGMGAIVLSFFRCGLSNYGDVA